MRSIKLIYFPLLLAATWLIWSCNPTRERRINRAWHTMTGHYNVYFNGEQKLLTAYENMENSMAYDFTRILPVFPYSTEAGARSAAGQMDDVLKKASLSIQNHTVGKYTDDSYLLMGKAHFFKGDYFAAIESFQYVNAKYKDKGLRPMATIWIAKSYSGMKKQEEGEAVIGLLLSEFGIKFHKGKEVKPGLVERWFPKQSNDFFREMYATAADIAIKQSKYQPATIYLERALQHTSRKTEKIRFTYIIGQLYLQADSVKEANKCFRRILRMNAPYEFEFNASINLARSYDAKNRSAVRQVRRSLKRMLKDDKNEGLYDQIYFELGNLEAKEKNTNEAIRYYKLSANVSTKNPNQKALAYLALGNIYLNMPEYRLAQAYYDSTAATLAPDFSDYKRIIAKKEMLSQLIDNLVVIETEDSLQRIARLSQPELEKKIDQWILAEKQQRQDKAKLEQRKKALAKEAAQQAAMNPDIGTGTLGGMEAGAWYFYNPSLIAAGAADFFSTRKWGRRGNEDFWRLSGKEKELAPMDEGGSGNVASGDSTKKAQADTIGISESGDVQDQAPQLSTERKAWVKHVPYDDEALKRSNNRIMEAYYNIGVLYDEKLSDYKESSKAFEVMLERYPGNEFEAEVMYRLTKLYLNLKDSSRSNYVRAQLITKYPESPYALILQHKPLKTAETDANKEVTAFYEKMYAEYLNGNYAGVKSMKKEAERNYPGNALRAKFDLLYALAVGKTDSASRFKTELELIVKDYPKTDVADRASGILAMMKKQEAALLNKDSTSPAAAALEADFTMEPTQPHYVIFATRDSSFDNNSGLNFFNKYNEDFSSMDNLRVNNYMSPEGYQMIMIREFADMKKGTDYLKSLTVLDVIKSQLKFNGKYLIFAISVTNFKKMLKEQKADSYAKSYADYMAKQLAPKQ